jgi:hypothetical protein
MMAVAPGHDAVVVHGRVLIRGQIAIFGQHRRRVEPSRWLRNRGKSPERPLRQVRIAQDSKPWRLSVQHSSAASRLRSLDRAGNRADWIDFAA